MTKRITVRIADLQFKLFIRRLMRLTAGPKHLAAEVRTRAVEWTKDEDFLQRLREAGL